MDRGPYRPRQLFGLSQHTADCLITEFGVSGGHVPAGASFPPLASRVADKALGGTILVPSLLKEITGSAGGTLGLEKGRRRRGGSWRA